MWIFFLLSFVFFCLFVFFWLYFALFFVYFGGIELTLSLALLFIVICLFYFWLHGGPVSGTGIEG